MKKLFYYMYMWKYFPLEVKRDKLHKIEHMYGYLKKQARFSRIIVGKNW